MHNPCGGRPRRAPPKAGGGAGSAPPAAGETPPISAGRPPAKGGRAQKSGQAQKGGQAQKSGRAQKKRAGAKGGRAIFPKFYKKQPPVRQQAGGRPFQDYCGSGRSPNNRARKAAKSSATATAPASSSSPSGVQPARMPMQGTPFAAAP